MIQANLSFPELDDIRASLMRWAAHILHANQARRELVDRTLAIASSNPFKLPEDEPVDRALMSLMLRIAQSDFQVGRTIKSSTEPV